MQTITIVLTDCYSDWEIAPLTGAGGAYYGAEFAYTSPKGGPLTSVGGLAVAGTARFAPPAAGVVVLCGSPAFEQGEADISAALRRAHETGCVVAGICGGTAAMARAGLLDRARHTSNGPGYLEKLAPAYAGAAQYVDQPMALRDDGIVTAAASAPVSFAVEVLIAAGLAPEAAGEMRTILGREFAP